jgi:hypothetical protein
MLRRAREPLNDPFDGVVFRPLGRRPLYNVPRQKIPRIDVD